MTTLFSRWVYYTRKREEKNATSLQPWYRPSRGICQLVGETWVKQSMARKNMKRNMKRNRIEWQYTRSIIFRWSPRGDFKLYVQVCGELWNWYHALDHSNYAQWLLVHVRDMVMFANNHPDVYNEYITNSCGPINGSFLKKSNFAVQKSAQKLSLIAEDAVQSSLVINSSQAVCCQIIKVNHLVFPIQC